VVTDLGQAISLIQEWWRINHLSLQERESTHWSTPSPMKWQCSVACKVSWFVHL